MKVSGRRALVVALVCLALLSAIGSAQNTIHVPADVSSIQAAISLAQNGDTVLVEPGLYFDSLNFLGKNITVMSSGGATVTTVNSSFQLAAAFNSNESNSAVLQGFTFINSSGIQISFSSPIIAENVITNSQSCAGGISAFDSNAVIRGNTISNNRQFCSGPSAGGIVIDGVSNVQVLNNTISGNQAAPGGQAAGGIYTDAQGTTTIINNKIQNNVVDGSGGGILANGSNVIIAGNLITGNSASAGGGIQIVPGSNAIVVNNTVALNTASQGAQLQMDGTIGTVSLFNNIFYDLTGNGAIFCSAIGFSGFPIGGNNDVVSFVGDPSGPPVAAYSGACPDQTGLNGNLQVAPQFLDVIHGDFHLAYASPLVDAGNSSAPNLPAQDLDGSPRIAAGSNLCLPAIDIGAYELLFNSVGSASLFPSSVQFPSTFIGVPFPFSQPITVTGTQGCTQITSITAGAEFPQTSNCSVLLAGQSCTIQVSFAPAVPGLRTAALKVNTLAPATALTAELSGTAQNSATATPAELDFGIQPVNSTQFQGMSIFSNQGLPLIVSGVSITGDFQQFNGCMQSVSNACFIAVQFTPATGGPHSGILTVTSNLGVLTIPLKGEGAAPAPALSPVSLSFPSQTVGTPGTPQVITLTNIGNADLFWNSLITTPDFQATPIANCLLQLAPGSSCSFSVIFNPTTIGSITGRIDIGTNAGTVTAILTGTGTVPIATLNPQSLNFATQALNSFSAAQSITVTNISGGSLNITSLSAPDNFLATSSCAAVLNINASCTISVVFDPTTIAPYGGSLTLGTNLGQVTAALTVGSSHVFHVPSEVPTIDQAVQFAQDGDTVLVAPGTYFGQISFLGKAITIASSGGADVTTLDGSIFAGQNEGPGSVLKGFTITHAANGAVLLSQSSPTIENNIISENAGCEGSAIEALASSAIIRHNVISNNTSGCNGNAGAIHVLGFVGGGPTQILDNVITGNQSSFGNGGGISVSDGGFANITGNTIQNNSSGVNGGGVAVGISAAANLIQNLITGNTAAQGGGGVWIAQDFSSQLINNTIADNNALSGSAVLLESSGNVFIANNVITASNGGAAIGCSITALGGNFIFNDVFGVPGGSAYDASCGDRTSIAGNIAQDPQFINSSVGNYRLQSTSPAIDVGNNFAANNSGQTTVPDHDLDGNGRILPGSPATCNGIIDMGAYEFTIGPNGTPGALPSSFDFGTGQVGFTGAPFIFSLTAQGCVGFASIKTTGDFQQTNTCSGAVSTFRSCSISVSFNPQHIGLESGTLTVDFGTSAPPVTVTLTGQGISNPPIASPANLSFGAQPPGTTSAPQQISIFPTAPGQSLVNAIWITGDFAQTNNCNASGTAAGSGCQINVFFAPTGSGTGQGSLNVSTNQGVVVVPLNGQIVSLPSVRFSTASLTFGTQLVGTSSVAQAVTMTNTGTGVLFIGSVALTSIGPSDFSQINKCGTSLPVGSSCTINVTFKPLAGGARTANLLLTSNASPAPPAVTFSGTGQAIQITPASGPITFAGQLVNTTSPPQAVPFTNNGDLPASIAAITTSGDFAQTNDCPTSLPVGSTCTVNVTFTPTVRGGRTGVLSIAGNFTGAAPQLTLGGSGQIIQGTASPTSLTFTDQQVGTTSLRQTINVTNSGDLALAINSVTATGDFIVTNSCPASLLTGSVCQVNVAFAPTALGSRSGTVVINTNAGTSVPAITLTGNAVGPLPVFSVPSLTFGPQFVGTSSASQAVTLTNSGTLTLTISGFNLNSDYTQTNNCGASLQPGASCSVNVTFHPVNSGSRPGTMFVIGNVFGTPPTPLNLSGTGETMQVTAAPASLSFAPALLNVSSAVQSVTFSNSGDLPVSITGVTINGDFAQTNNCGTSLAAGASCIVNVVFTPTARGARNGVLSFTSGSPGTAPTVALSGTGQAVLASVTPASLSFAAAAVNTTSAVQIATFTNAGDAPITLQGVSINGDFAQTNTCGTSLAVGASCAVNIAFTPTSRGTRTGAITLLGNFTSPAPVVTLTGTGQAFLASLTPASFDFGNEPVNTTANAHIFTYTNTGDLPLSISTVAVTPDFNQTNTCPSTLAVGTSCTINVTFVPRAVGVQSASLTVSANINSTATLSGNGVMPQAGLSPVSLDFGHQRVGTASAPQLVTVTNTGSFAFFINQISFPGGYQVTNNCPSLVNPGTSCTVSVIFAPTTVQPGTGSLTIGGDFAATPASVTLSGTTDFSNGSIFPGTLTFASQNVGSSSSPRTVTLSSTGDVPLNITSIQTTGDFSQTNNCGSAVPATGSCTITVTFNPAVHGSRTGTLTVSSDANTPIPSVALSGNATIANASWTPASLGFADQLINTASAAQSVTLTNSGDGVLSITSIAATGDFTQSNTCGNTLAAGATCLVSVIFRPVTTGARSGSLTLISNSSVAVLPITLSGNGTAPVASLSPASLLFANQIVNTSSPVQALTLSNTGTGVLNISSIAVAGDFSQTNNCGTSLAAGAACIISVAFNPTASGTRAGTLTVSDNSSAGSVQTANLTGTAIDFSMSASPASITLNAGKTATYTVTLNSLGASFGSAVTLSCSGLPAASSCSFAPASVTPGSTAVKSTLQVLTTPRGKVAGTPAGTYTITIIGTSGSLQHSTTIRLIVN